MWNLKKMKKPIISFFAEYEMIGHFFDRDLKNGYTIVLFCLSSRPEIFMDRGCFEGHEWFRYLGALGVVNGGSNSFIRETHNPSIPIFLLIFHHVLFFFHYSYSSHVSLYFQKCKGKSGTYRSTTIFIEITSRFRITNCLLIDRLINSCKMIIKR